MPSKMLEVKAMEKLMIGNSVGCTNPPLFSYAHGRSELNLTRLDRGLLFFIYLHGSSKLRLNADLALWENGMKLIKNDRYSREYSNIEIFFSKKIPETHPSKELSNLSQYIRTQTDYDVYQLIRFIRNFTLSYFDQVIRHRAALYKDVLLLMIYLVHYLSPKRDRSIGHLYLFLGKRTIQSFMSKKDLLNQLIKPLDVPDVIFDREVAFGTEWYRSNTKRKKIDFNGLSSDFIQYFNRIFIQYYEGRLKSNGMKKAWNL